MALSDPDHVRQYVAKELNRVYGFDIPEDVVKGVMTEIFPRFRDPNDFMETYFPATVKLLEKLKVQGTEIDVLSQIRFRHRHWESPYIMTGS
jgi:hypothetical protein